MNRAYHKIERTIHKLDFENIFIFDDLNHRQYTYNEYFEKCLAIADFLDKRNSNKPIVAIKENSVELSMLYFTAMLTNITIMVIDPQKELEEINTILQELPKSRIICDKDIRFPEYTIHEFIDFESSIDIGIRISDVKQAVIKRLCERDFTIPYLVTFTSGTSGMTKGVMHSLDNLFLSAYALHEKINTPPQSCLLHVMPMTYMAGILNSLIYPFVAEASIVITERFSIINARFFWKKVITHTANLFWLSPAMLLMIEQLDRGSEGKHYCENNPTVFLIGTAALTVKTREKFNQKYGVTVQASYGLTETLFISVETIEGLSAKRPYSVGEFLDGVEYQLLDTEELLLYVPWMYLGYTNENTELYFINKYYKSGDLANIKEDQLFITGRCKDLIVKGGMNISSVLLESCILENTEVTECAILGVKDRTGEEKICCVYILDKQLKDEDIEADIKKIVKEKLGKNYFIDYFWNVDMMIRNINGKIDKKKMISIWEVENGKHL